MKELIHVSERTIGDGSVQSVNARELHLFLEVGKDFSTWIKDRIEQYSFAEGQDYAIFDSPELGNQTSRGGDRRSKLYAISIDMAKELSMVERNEKGKQARQYFIECEKQAKSGFVDIHAALSDPATLRMMLTGYTEKVIELQAVVEEQAPKVVALDRFANHEGQHNIRNAAKLLGLPERKLISWMQQHRWLYRDNESSLRPYAERIAAGFMDTRPVEIRGSGFDERFIKSQTMITQKGLAHLAVLLAKAGLIQKQEAVA
jgi:phage anti-repressor protein/phage antirepressor YoqD-like protein